MLRKRLRGAMQFMDGIWGCSFALLMAARKCVPQDMRSFLQSTDRPTRERIKTGILGLIRQPPIGDIKMLQGWKPASYRLRIGKYRIIYSHLQNQDGETYLFIRDIGSRGGIYK